MFGIEVINMRRELTRSEIREIKIRKNKIRRERQLRRRIVFVSAIIILLICSAFGMTSFLSKAQEANGAPAKAKCFNSIQVEYGSSLSEIANEYCDDDMYESHDDYIKEVMFINHMNDTAITAGHYLIVPYYVEIN